MNTFLLYTQNTRFLYRWTFVYIIILSIITFYQYLFVPYESSYCSCSYYLTIWSEVPTTPRKYCFDCYGWHLYFTIHEKTRKRLYTHGWHTKHPIPNGVSRISTTPLPDVNQTHPHSCRFSRLAAAVRPNMPHRGPRLRSSAPWHRSALLWSSQPT